MQDFRDPNKFLNPKKDKRSSPIVRDRSGEAKGSGGEILKKIFATIGESLHKAAEEAAKQEDKKTKSEPATKLTLIEVMIIGAILMILSSGLFPMFSD